MPVFKAILKAGFLLLFIVPVGLAQLPKALIEINQHQILVELAKTEAEHQQGLSGRKILPKNTGMYFIFSDLAPHSFWMKDMNFPLDMVWIRQGEIVGITSDIPMPVSKTADLPVYPSPGAVDAVLEINAGDAMKKGFKVGDKVRLAR